MSGGARVLVECGEARCGGGAAAMRRTRVPGALHKQRRVMRGAAVAILPCIKWRNSIFGWLRRHSLHRVAANQQEEFAHRRVLRQRLRLHSVRSLARSISKMGKKSEWRGRGRRGHLTTLTPRHHFAPKCINNFGGEAQYYWRKDILHARPAASRALLKGRSGAASKRASVKMLVEFGGGGGGAAAAPPPASARGTRGAGYCFKLLIFKARHGHFSSSKTCSADEYKLRCLQLRLLERETHAPTLHTHGIRRPLNFNMKGNFLALHTKNG